MADPVIFDDGGSTRIKQLRMTTATGKMDDLLEVKVIAGSAQSTDTAIGAFSQLQIACIKADGTSSPPDLGGAPAPAGTFPIAMVVGDTFEVQSGKHRVRGKLVNNAGMGLPHTAADCEITVKGTGGVDPIVEARHSGVQRRYIISNAPLIDTVDVNAAGPVKSFTIPAGTVYTLVSLT